MQIYRPVCEPMFCVHKQETLQFTACISLFADLVKSCAFGNDDACREIENKPSGETG
jgi:hypothetical protein